MRNKRRVVKLVTIVTVMFALSWLPIQVVLIMEKMLIVVMMMVIVVNYVQGVPK